MHKCAHTLNCTSACLQTHTYTQKQAHYGCNCIVFADGPFPKVSLKHLPTENLHRVLVVHTVWGKHTLCKWFFFWIGMHTTRNSVLMAIMSAKANGCCVFLLLCAPYWMCMYFLFHRTHPYVCDHDFISQDHLTHGAFKMQKGLKKFVSLYICQLISQMLFVKCPVI